MAVSNNSCRSHWSLFLCCTAPSDTTANAVCVLGESLLGETIDDRVDEEW